MSGPQVISNRSGKRKPIEYIGHVCRQCFKLQNCKLNQLFKIYIKQIANLIKNSHFDNTVCRQASVVFQPRGLLLHRLLSFPFHLLRGGVASSKHYRGTMPLLHAEDERGRKEAMQNVCVGNAKSDTRWRYYIQYQNVCFLLK